MKKLNSFEAIQFAMMLLAGIPAGTATAYFAPGLAPEENRDQARAFASQPEVAAEMQRLSGGVPWQEMEKEARLRLALDKTYAEMAYFLWSHNYSDINGFEKEKADKCREVLEKKLAGTAGEDSPLDKFYKEVIEQQRAARIGKVGKA